MKCNYCGAEFDEPLHRRCIENLDGENGWEETETDVCPYCGTPVFPAFEMKGTLDG